MTSSSSDTPHRNSNDLALENRRLRRRVAELEAALAHRAGAAPTPEQTPGEFPLPREPTDSRADFRADSPADSPADSMEPPERPEERFRKLLATIPNVSVQGYWADGTVFYWNEASRSVYGYGPEEAIGRNLLDLIIPDEIRERVREDIRRMAETGEVSPAVEVELRRKDGARVPVFSNHAVILGPDGDPELYCLDLDLTENRRLTRALRRSEERLRLAMEAAEDGYWDWDLRTGRVYWSPRCYTMLGYPPDAFPVDFDRWRSLIHPDEREATRKAVEEKIHRGDAFRAEFRHQTADGGWRWIMGRGRTVERDADGEPIRMVGTHVDVTDRRRAEQAQRKTARLLEAILGHSPALVTVLDADARYVLVNQAAADVIGKPAGRLRGRTLADILPAEMAALFRARIRKVLGERAPMTVHESIPLAGGLRDYETTLFPIETDDGPLLGGIARDVTERNRAEANRRELERRLLRAQKLESLGVLAGGVAHDFNNILMTVMGNLELAMEDPAMEDFSRESLEEALKAARRAADLTRQMLAYSGKGKFLNRSVDLNELIRENAPMIRAALSGRLTLTLELADRLPPILADPEQIRQVVINLATNAAEAMGDESGTVTLKTDLAILDAEALAAGEVDPPIPGPFVRLSVIDAGSGMSPETRNRLFEPFFTTKFLGRGLGMSAVQGIVRGHGGSLFVDSAPGRGTIVRAAFPAGICPPTKDADPPSAEASAADGPSAETAADGRLDGNDR